MTAQNSAATAGLQVGDPTELARQQRWLEQFLLLLRGLAAAFGLGELGLSLVLRHWPLGVIAALTLLVAASTWISRVLLLRGRLKDAASLLGYGILVTGAVAGPLAPYGRACLSLVPTLAVAAMLPYLRGRELGLFLAVAFASTMWIVGSAEWLRHVIVVPEQVGAVIDVVATAAPALMLLLLLRQFSARLNGALAEAQRTIEIRDEFLTVASHELRTPLTALQLAVEGLRGTRAPVAPERLARSVELMRGQVQTLAALVSNLLIVGRIQHGGLQPSRETFELGELVREVARRFSGRAELRVEAEPAEGSWDREGLDQVVTHVIANAVKFGLDQPIAVGVADLGARVRLTVTDRGVGIDPHRLPHLFDKFERAAPVMEYGGLGLGLFISRAIVTSLGGEIRAQSEGLGQGATVTVELPR